MVAGCARAAAGNLTVPPRLLTRADEVID